MSLLEQVLSNLKRLPSLPEAVTKLAQALRNPETNAADIENIIRPDPALTTNLLSLANSAYFGFSKEISSVKQAVVLMGQNRVYELAVSGAFSSVILPHMDGYGMSAKDFWSHSIAVAILSEKLALIVDSQVPDMTFTAGLVHDVGKIVMAPHLKSLALGMTEALSIQPEKSFFEIEHAILGTNHCEVGALVSQTWNLPSNVETAILWHHNPVEMPAESNSTIADLVHVADALAHLLGLGMDVGGLRRKCNPLVIERIGLTEERLNRILPEALEQIDSMKDMMAMTSKSSAQKTKQNRRTPS